MTYAISPRQKHLGLGVKITVVLATSIFFYLIIITGMNAGIQLIHKGRIFPSISIAGVNLSGLTPSQATASLEGLITYPSEGQVVFRYGDEVWMAHPQELGLVFDVGRSMEQAYALGRGGLFSGLTGQLFAIQGGLELAPVIVLDERVAHGYLQNLAVQINQPMMEAELYILNADAVYYAGQAGRTLNVDQTLDILIDRLQNFTDCEVPLVISEEYPQVIDAASQVEAIHNALSSALTLALDNPQVDDPGPWILEPALLAGMITIAREENENGWGYSIGLDEQALRIFLKQILPEVNREPHNARFYFDDEIRQLVLIQPSEEGRVLDIEASILKIEKQLFENSHFIALVVTSKDPAVTSTATAESLGITEDVSDGYYNTTYFRGSSSERLQNIRTAAEQFHGLLIPPESTFSMGDALGDISLDNGYAEALIIYNGRTITGVGGGVCQVSTTLFRTAFFAGYPIVERHAHAYRVLYYEQRPGSGIDPSMAGLDATVFFPLVDLKIINDRPYWLLMETYFDAEDMSLTWKFYSTDDGRSVTWQNLGLRNIIPAPAPMFEEFPDLPPGTCQQVDYQADGADITITRTVNDLNGYLLFNDNIQTHYEAWQAVYQYGPGTENPEVNCIH